MRILLIISFLLIALPLGLLAFLKATPGQLAGFVRIAGGGGMLALGTLLTTRGLALIGGPLALFGFLMLTRGFGMSGGGFSGFGRGNKTSGQSSNVRTSILHMELDHDSGDMDGDILTGEFSGRRLSTLTIEELLALMGECELAQDQSQDLLEAYLDRKYPEWREGQNASDRSGKARPTGGPMSVQEAYDILGLEPGASKADIRKAHRSLMKQFHPDQGGSDYLAARINEAKDVLL